jgi:rhodanese-related sulfurtransferase
MLPPLAVSAESVQQRLASGERLVFLDTRSPEEWEAADRQIAGALRFRPSESENHLRFVPQGCPIVTYCDCADAECSTRAAAALVQNGWRDVHPLEPGAWRSFPSAPKVAYSLSPEMETR